MLCSCLHSRLLRETNVNEGWGKPAVTTWTRYTGDEGQCTVEWEHAFCVRWSLNHGVCMCFSPCQTRSIRGEKTAGARRNIPLPSHWHTPRDAHLSGYSHSRLFSSLSIYAICSVNENMASWNVLKTLTCLLAHQRERKLLCRDEAGSATPMFGPDNLWSSLHTYLFWALHKSLTNRLLRYLGIEMGLGWGNAIVEAL